MQPLRLYCLWYHQRAPLSQGQRPCSCYFEILGLPVLSLCRLAFKLWGVYCDSSISYHQELHISSTIHDSMSQIVFSHDIENLCLARLTTHILSMGDLSYKSRTEQFNRDYLPINTLAIHGRIWGPYAINGTVTLGEELHLLWGEESSLSESFLRSQKGLWDL